MDIIWNFLDQRVSALAVSLLVGISVVLAAALEQVPFAVLYGVFLYMGISGIAGIQLFDRLFLMLMPVKHHPRVGYCKRVSFWHIEQLKHQCLVNVLLIV